MLEEWAEPDAERLCEAGWLERRTVNDTPMPDGWYPHEPDHPSYGLNWVFLHEHPEILRRHWARARWEGRM